MTGAVLTAILVVLGAAGAIAGWGVRQRRRLVLVTVDGASMAPTLAPGERLVARRVRPGTAHTGQIVVVERPFRDGVWQWRAPNPPLVPGRYMIKRIAAVAGQPVPAPVLPVVGATPGAVVPAGQVVLLGDNQHDSLDSRDIGYIPADRVLGIVWRRFGSSTPLDR
jgi:signal peptidase I